VQILAAHEVNRLRSLPPRRRGVRLLTTWSGAIPSSNRKWPRCFASIVRSRCGEQWSVELTQEPQIAVISMTRNTGLQGDPAPLAPDLRPLPASHPTISRDHEYKRHGTVTLMAGIDLLTGQVHALRSRIRHRNREFIRIPH